MCASFRQGGQHLVDAGDQGERRPYVVIAYIAGEHTRGVAAVGGAQLLHRPLDVLVDRARFQPELACDFLRLEVASHPHEALPLAWRERGQAIHYSSPDLGSRCSEPPREAGAAARAARLRDCKLA
jgi:hypothetical protein